jgi:hypothetical protein
MANNTEEPIHKLQYLKSIILVIAVSEVLFVSRTVVSGLFPGNVTVVDAPKAFAQEQQNQTTNASTPSNNATNATIAAASTYNEMLNPRQTEYPDI